MKGNRGRKITAGQVKRTAKTLGAALCGIAPAERFNGAPEGFRPSDIFPQARSVIVLAKRVPEGMFAARSLVPYTLAYEVLFTDVFRLAGELALRLQDRGIVSVPVPSEPYEYWNAEAKEGRGILSLRHAGYLAGLGVLGKNGLLINRFYGNRIVLGALLADAALEADPLARYALCPEECTLCLDHCPARALDGKTVSQGGCRGASERVTPKGYELYGCITCRKICPAGRGARTPHEGRRGREKFPKVRTKE